jgi:succinyl-CoA synthetase alpha subunit
VTDQTRVIIQGSSPDAPAFASSMLSFGTHVVGSIGFPIPNLPQFQSVSESVRATDANTSLNLESTPGSFLDAADHGIKFIVSTTPSILISLSNLNLIKDRLAVRGVELLGPNSPGLVQPRSNISIGRFPKSIFSPGRIAVLATSVASTELHNICEQLTFSGLGQSIVIGIGDHEEPGQTSLDIVKRFAEDPFTDGIVVIGNMEENAARWISKTSLVKSKPIVACLDAFTEAFESAGLKITKQSRQLPRMIFREMKS